MPEYPFTARVVKPWSVKYPDPITLEPGDLVTVGRRDPEYPGWIWATSLRLGTSGWTPEEWLEERDGSWRSTVAYDARELAVEPDEIVIVERELLGFAWVNRDGVQGWVPRGHLVRAADPMDVPM